LASKRRLEVGVSKLGKKMHCSRCGGEDNNANTCTTRDERLKVFQFSIFSYLV